MRLQKNTSDYTPLSPPPHRPVAFIEMNSIYYQQVQKKKTLVRRVS